MFYNQNNRAGAIGYFAGDGSFIQTQSFGAGAFGYWTQIVTTEKPKLDESLIKPVDMTVMPRRSFPDITARPEFNQLRRKLLSSAIPFYERLLRQTSNDDGGEAERGLAIFVISPKLRG